MAWLGPLSERCLRLLVVAATLYVVALAAERLRVVLLAVGLAVVLAVVLRPLVRRLEARGAPAGLAASVVLLGAVAVVGGAAAATVPPTVAELGDLDVGISGGLERVQDWLAGSAVGVGEADEAGFLERAEQEVRDNAGRIATGVVAGATLATEVLAGAALALVLLFFGLKDGPAIRRWLVAVLPPGARADAEAIGRRALETLSGYARGVTLVALFDAAFIALALMLVGVPLVVPLAVLTFLGAYVPIVGAFVAGIAAVLVALVTGGVLDAALVAGAVILVQQVESNVLQPVLVGRSVQLHPVAVVLSVATGGVLAGIVGAVVGPPLVAVAAAALRYWRFERDTLAPV